MRHVLGTRPDPTPLSSLSQRGNVECGWSDQLCPGLKGLWEAGLSVLQPGMSQENWDNLANLGGLTLSNLLRYLCEELFFFSENQALSLYGELASWSSTYKPISCLEGNPPKIPF